MPARWLRAFFLRSFRPHNLDRPLAQLPCPASHRQTIVAPARLFSSTSRRGQHVVPLRKELKDSSKAARLSRVANEYVDSLPERDHVEGWELTVGIEIHAQLNTARKLFSEALTDPHLEPNSRLAHFDLALPGSQPVFQIGTLSPAIRAAVALGCNIQPVSHFDRKHYFYHDQPSGYQITQYYKPFATNGSVVLGKSDGLDEGQETIVGIKQVQLEQDTARTQEQDAQTSLVDFNRAGHPLIEIISRPEIQSPKIAAIYVKKVQALLQAVDAVTTGMELGGLRADVNVSVRRTGSSGLGHSYDGIGGLGQRTEIKNLSTFKGVEDAIRAERDRQIVVLEEGGSIDGETRGWSVTQPGVTRRLRGKEGEVDYRYMPDPDIPPLIIADDVIRHLTSTLPPLPEDLVHMLGVKYGMSRVDAATMIELDEGQRLLYLQDVVDRIPNRFGASLSNDGAEISVEPEAERGDASTEGKGPDYFNYEVPSVEGRAACSRRAAARAETGTVAANWILHEIGSLLSTNDQTWTPDLVPAGKLARLLELLLSRQITNQSAKRLLRIIFEGDKRSVDQIVHDEGLTFVQMAGGEYEALASSVIEKFPEHAKDIKNGKHGKIKFLLGQMMREGQKGSVQAQVAEAELRRQLLG